MYSGQRSEQVDRANSARTISEANLDSVTMHQNVGYGNGPCGFGACIMGLGEKQPLYQSSAGTFSENIQVSDERIRGVKKRKLVDDCAALVQLRRKRISERMKHLQDLVPGCSKISGKAAVLDEIINYMQSLQRQGEFLTTELATANLSKQLMLSQDRHPDFYGADPGPSRLDAQFNKGIMQPGMMCTISNHGNVLQGRIQGASTMGQIPVIWEGLEDLPRINFNAGVAADISASNSGLYMFQEG